MSDPYAGNPALFPATYPIPDDSDPPTAAAFNPAAEALGDRTAWLKAKADAFVAVFTPLANLTALKAITAPTDDLMRTVRKFGQYVFHAGDTTTAKDPWVMIPTDATAGRWIRAGNELRQGEGRSIPPVGMLGTKDRVPRSKDAHFVNTQTNFEWQFIDGKITLSGATGSNAAGYLWCIDEKLFDGATISLISATVKGHTGSLPATKMSMGVFRSNVASSAPELQSLVIAAEFFEDASVDGTEYGDWHNIYVLPDQYHIVDKQQYSYFIQFWDEYGTNASSGNLLSGFVMFQNNAYESKLGGVA